MPMRWMLLDRWKNKKWRHGFNSLQEFVRQRQVHSSGWMMKLFYKTFYNFCFTFRGVQIQSTNLFDLHPQLKSMHFLFCAWFTQRETCRICSLLSHSEMDLALYITNICLLSRSCVVFCHIFLLFAYEGIYNYFLFHGLYRRLKVYRLWAFCWYRFTYIAMVSGYKNMEIENEQDWFRLMLCVCWKIQLIVIL